MPDDDSGRRDRPGEEEMSLPYYDHALSFKRDTEFRKQFFVPNSFAHPAKMDAQLLIWLVEHYSEPGQTILDPMFGSGTTMLACTLGRNVIGVELEQKFVDMAKQNWEKVRQRPQLGCAMGDCTILLGDARNLPQVLCDAIITSPPYEGSLELSTRHTKGGIPGRDAKLGQTGTYADVVISSPPYASAGTKADENPENYIRREEERLKLFPNRPKTFVGRYSGDRENIGNLPYGRIDAILTSPPYEAAVTGKDGIDWSKGTRGQAEGWKPRDRSKEPAFANAAIGAKGFAYSESSHNIGNLKAESYLAAMLTVYQNCYTVLKGGGLMVLVVKNFIRNKAEVDLRADTVKLAEQAGFAFLGEHYRKLTQQSFWRILYRRKYPEGPVIDKEYVLAFRKILL